MKVPGGKGGISQRPFFMEGLLLAATLAWGMSLIWVKQITNAGVPVNLFIVIRYGLAAVVMTPFCIPELRRLSRAELGFGGLIGGLMYLALAAQVYGLRETTPANSGFITAAYVAFVPFTAWIILKQRPTRRLYLSAGLCLVGLYVLTLGPGQNLEANRGNLITLVCALAWSVQLSVLTLAVRRGGVKALTIVPLLTIFGLSLVLAGATGGFDPAGADLKAAMLPMILCALFPTLLAGLAQTYAQQHIEPGRAAVIFTLESVFSCVVSVALGMEELTVGLCVGGGIIIAAVLLCQRGAQKREETDEPQ